MTDIERTYGGGKKPLASRVPLVPGQTVPSPATVSDEVIANDSGFTAILDEGTTPAATEGTLSHP